MGSIFSLEGRTALVTGSTKGIGLAIARGLARAGATVILNGRDTDRLNSVVDQLSAERLDARGAPFDVTDPSSVRNAAEEIEASVGPLDTLVNNAGITRRGPFEKMSLDDWSSILETNATGVFVVTKAFAPAMRKKKRGSIINICSLMSSIARKDNANYAASKGAVAMFTKAIAVEFGAEGVTVNGIAPGFFDTPLTEPLVTDREFSSWIERRVPLGRWGDPEDLAGAAVFLASDASRYVSGQILYVDGGLSAAI